MTDDDLQDRLDTLEDRLGILREEWPFDEDPSRSQSMFLDRDDLDDVEREHLENIQQWRDEERAEGVERPVHGMTPAEAAWYSLMLDTTVYGERPDPILPDQYWERFPDAPGNPGTEARR